MNSPFKKKGIHAMAYRNGNYTAFYVAEPFNENNLGAASTPDFVYYNLLRMWKGKESDFPFIDAHDKTYNVRDSSDWEKTLKPRLHQRLLNSKNIILFLSSETKSSRALREEIDYGINGLGLPVIVIYPDCSEVDEIADPQQGIRTPIRNLWDKLPVFKNNMKKVATLHVPLNKVLIRTALKDPDLMVTTMTMPDLYYY